METRAVLRGVRLSADKGRLVADLIRGKKVEQALKVYEFAAFVEKGGIVFIGFDDEKEPFAPCRQAALSIETGILTSVLFSSYNSLCNFVNSF